MFDMLSHVSSRELALWQAYERREGPLGPQYERTALQAIAIYTQQSEKARFPSPVDFMKPTATADDFGSDSFIPDGGE